MSYQNVTIQIQVYSENWFEGIQNPTVAAALWVALVASNGLGRYFNGYFCWSSAFSL